MDSLSDIFALWPLAVVVGLAAVFIRLGRRSKRHDVQGPDSQAGVYHSSGRNWDDGGGGGDGGGTD